MKLITAIVREHKLDQVREALLAADITRITVTRVSGHGRQVEENLYRGEVVVPNLIPKIRIDIAVNDEFVKTACDAIISSAKSDGDGELGDGKIFISPLEECIRIRTSETGSSAI
ncbi:MAG: P-II family nitrogen regulator [Sedimentisphaeraceae bacterium JB056]